VRRAGNHTSLRGAVADRSAAPDRLHRDRAAWIRWSLLGVLGPPVKIAAYQAPLLGSGSMDAIGLIRDRIAWCESAGVEILCCPEGVVGGLADYAPAPAAIAIDVAGGQLTSVLAPLASGIVSNDSPDCRPRGFQQIRRAVVRREAQSVSSDHGCYICRLSASSTRTPARAGSLSSRRARPARSRSATIPCSADPSSDGIHRAGDGRCLVPDRVCHPAALP
jgi:hypothetical protein